MSQPLSDGAPAAHRSPVPRVILFALPLVGMIAGCDAPPPAEPAAGASAPATTGVERPNILLIVADDLGYTDLGVFGSEIETPNLDALARDGLLLTQFYTSPMCSPSRAMLLSGMNNHRAGMGTLYEKIADNQRGREGYEGYLPERVAALPELMKAAGYRTYMTGKWHLGTEQQHSPAAAGFEKSFALVESGAGHFADMQPLSGPAPALYREDGRQVDALPADFYSTRFYAQRLIEYIDADHGSDRPFFAYLAFTAPHFPLQAPDALIEKYAGRYDEGYDALHRRRIDALRERDLLDADAAPFPRLPWTRPWAELSDEERRISARRMEIYAAMIDELDRQVGRVVDYLKSSGEFDNTVLFFLSDNGAEGHWLHQGLVPLHEYAQQCCDNSLENMGRPGSYLMLGPEWARVATGPYRLFKGFTSEGGIRVPAFIHYPAAARRGAAIRQGMTVMDVMPTLLELAGIQHPAPEFDGRQVLPPQGRSLAGLLEGTGVPVHGEVFDQGWEFLGKRAYRLGNWKIVWQPAQPGWGSWPGGIQTDQWQLYDLTEDPAELNDLSTAYPQKRTEMIARWQAYASDNGVVLPDRISGY